MVEDLLNLIPIELLNLIWKNIKPSVKYSLNKHYLNKYYIYHFCLIHKKIYCYNKPYINTINSYLKYNDLIKFLYNIKFNKYDYYYYILKNNLSLFIEITLNFYIKNLYADYNINLNINKLHQNKFIYKNIYFNNLIDFFNYYCNSNKTKNIINNIIKNYNLSHLIKKSHKNNANKNIRWTL